MGSSTSSWERELGGRPDDPACYENGHVHYDRLARTDRFLSGLERVVRGAGRQRIALLCAEKEPLNCHRTLLVSRALDERGLAVAHIHADGELEPHREAMGRLLDMAGLSDEDLFETRRERIARAVARRQGRATPSDDPPDERGGDPETAAAAGKAGGGD